MPGNETMEIMKEKTSQALTWKWLVGVFIVGGIPSAIWAGAIKADTASVAETTRTLAQGQSRIADIVADHATKLAASDTDRAALHKQLDSVERTVEKIDSKLDRVLERK